MTPEEKAKHIYYKFLNMLLKDSATIIKEYIGLNPKAIEAISIQSQITCGNAKQSALISVDLIIDAIDDVHNGMTGENIRYWREVKKEVEKL